MINIYYTIQAFITTDTVQYISYYPAHFTTEQNFLASTITFCHEIISSPSLVGVGDVKIELIISHPVVGPNKFNPNYISIIYNTNNPLDPIQLENIIKDQLGALYEKLLKHHHRVSLQTWRNEDFFGNSITNEYWLIEYAKWSYENGYWSFDDE